MRHCAASPVVTPPHSVPDGSAVTALAPRNEEEEGKEGRRCEGGERGLDADREKIKLTVLSCRLLWCAGAVRAVPLPGEWGPSDPVWNVGLCTMLGLRVVCQKFHTP